MDTAYLDEFNLKHRSRKSGDVCSDAIFSNDERYRYSLRRTWDLSLPTCTFIMLNPSTATEEVEDPTVRRTQFYARREGFGSVHVLNIFAFRARWPEDMARQDDPVGPANQLLRLLTIYDDPGKIICAWGNNGRLRGRSREVSRELAISVYSERCFSIGELTLVGEPKHPLYLRSDAPLLPLFLFEVPA